MFKSWYEKLVGKSVVKTPIYDTVIAQLNSIHKDIQSILIDIKADKELLVKELCKKEMIIKTMIENSPDMLWFKDTQGKYLYANKAIRDGLLLDDHPEGKTDIELATAAKLKYGEREHTFGEVCGNSDVDVIDNMYEGKTYVESGKVKGKMLHLEVNKSVVLLDGSLLGVVGSGRDITEYREELINNSQMDVFKKNEFVNKDV